jgi:hypothetical protein
MNYLPVVYFIFLVLARRAMCQSLENKEILIDNTIVIAHCEKCIEMRNYFFFEIRPIYGLSFCLKTYELLYNLNITQGAMFVIVRDESTCLNVHLKCKYQNIYSYYKYLMMVILDIKRIATPLLISYRMRSEISDEIGVRRNQGQRPITSLALFERRSINYTQGKSYLNINV